MTTDPSFVANNDPVNVYSVSKSFIRFFNRNAIDGVLTIGCITMSIIGSMVTFQVIPLLPSITLGLEKFFHMITNIISPIGASILGGAVFGFGFLLKAIGLTLVAVWKFYKKQYSTNEKLNKAKFKNELMLIWVEGIPAILTAVAVGALLTGIVASLGPFIAPLIVGIVSCVAAYAVGKLCKNKYRTGKWFVSSKYEKYVEENFEIAGLDTRKSSLEALYFAIADFQVLKVTRKGLLTHKNIEDQAIARENDMELNDEEKFYADRCLEIDLHKEMLMMYLAEIQNKENDEQANGAMVDIQRMIERKQSESCVIL